MKSVGPPIIELLFQAQRDTDPQLNRNVGSYKKNIAVVPKVLHCGGTSLVYGICIHI